MTNTIGYHEAAIQYNSELAEHSEKLAETLGDDTVRKWCRSVAKQHRKHQRLHERSLDRLIAEMNEVEGVHVTNNYTIVNVATPPGHDVLRPFDLADISVDEAAPDQTPSDVETDNSNTEAENGVTV